MVKAKSWKIAKLFDGVPKDEDLQLVEEDLPGLKDGEMLIEAVYLTVDPYMRVRLETNGKVGDTMMGEQISKVIESKNKDYPVGTIVRSYSGWRSRTIVSAEACRRMPELGDLSLSTALGVMGMPGMTAFFGFLEICSPKEGEVVVVNGAAGAVGSLVGQIAKIKGCKVIGFAGDEEKCKWIKSLGFDCVYNYKKVNIDDALKEAAPEGVDCYFDNVGGEFTLSVLKNMKLFGRMSICGQISQYNATDKLKAELPFPMILFKQLLVQGFIVTRWYPRWAEGEKQMSQWIREGKITYKETVTEGFENMYTAFRGLFKGSNTGKAIVKC
ncbi:prostaglandin reductase 1-like isoform X4 [Mytilus edulis]|uniref:prostaglandin reductase 1-like isoform X4 n=1 Tax=Mytilus edulis TaxID=6550 RepID=UPI0039EE58CF